MIYYIIAIGIYSYIIYNYQKIFLDYLTGQAKIEFKMIESQPSYYLFPKLMVEILKPNNCSMLHNMCCRLG